jgi:hypothetical protein
MFTNSDLYPDPFDVQRQQAIAIETVRQLKASKATSHKPNKMDLEMKAHSDRVQARRRALRNKAFTK